MSDPTPIQVRRQQVHRRLFPRGVPPLWCPPLTHYDRDGAIDGPRIRAHVRHLSRYAKGLLVPGSTGDGWEMNAGEIRTVLEIALDEAQHSGLHVLVGLLKTHEAEVLSSLHETLAWLQSRSTNADHAAQGSPAVSPPVCGFTICAPRGAQKTQGEIGDALSAILDTRLPSALYQLPQVTQNEIGAELASRLAMRYENFILFKDSSGSDRVVLSDKPLAGVFTVRGGEGDYTRWLRSAGGPYDGFLLGSANCFAAELSQIIEDLSAGRVEQARQMSERVTAVMGEVATLVDGLPDGNPFANANKAIDHFFAWGPQAIHQPPPRLHAGSCLPVDLIRAAGESLSRHRLMPAKGYL